MTAENVADAVDNGADVVESTEKSKRYTLLEFLTAYSPLQKAGKTAEEIAESMEMKLPSFRTKLSNSTLEVWASSADVNIAKNGEDDEVVSGHDYAERALMPVLKRQLDDAIKAEKDDAKREKLEKRQVSITDAYRALRKLVNSPDSHIRLADGCKPVDVPPPANSRGSRDVEEIANAAAKLFG